MTEPPTPLARTMLEGMTLTPLTKHPDTRGFFTEIVRQDWIPDDLQQANFSISYPETVRAWHRHVRGQTDYFVVLAGAIQLCAYDERTTALAEVITAGDVLQMVRVPGHYWHGFRVVGNDKAYLVYFVNKVYDYANPDEERRPWNDPKVIPSSINGQEDDPRCNRPWDWEYQWFR